MALESRNIEHVKGSVSRNPYEKRRHEHDAKECINQIFFGDLVKKCTSVSEHVALAIGGVRGLAVSDQVVGTT